MIYGLLILFFLATNAQAGIVGFGDVAMVGDNGNGNLRSLPEFKSRKEAIDWADRYFWVSGIEEKIKNKRYELQVQALSSIQKSSIKETYQENRKITPAAAAKYERDLLDLWDWYGAALTVVQERQKFIKGAVMYAGSYPIRGK